MSHYGWRHAWVLALVGILSFVAIGGIIWSMFRLYVPVYYTGHYYPLFFPFFPVGILGSLLFIFLLFAVMRWVFWGWGGRHRMYYDNSYHILRERYAKGEITKEQYEQMIRDLDRRI